MLQSSQPPVRQTSNEVICSPTLTLEFRSSVSLPFSHVSMT